MIKTRYDKNVDMYYLYDEVEGLVMILTKTQVEALIDCYCSANDRILM